MYHNIDIDKTSLLVDLRVNSIDSRISTHVKFLLTDTDNFDMTVSVSVSVSVVAMQALRRGLARDGGSPNLIEFIKAHRSLTGLGLRESKMICEWFINNVSPGV